MQQKEGITVGEQWLFSNSVIILLKFGNCFPRPLLHNITWPMTDLTHTDSPIHTDSSIPTCTDLAHKHIRPHKHIGPHRNIGQDQLTDFCSLLYIVSFNGYLSICPFLNKRFEEKSPVGPKFSTDICLLSWTIVSQGNSCLSGQFVWSSLVIVSSFPTFSRRIPLCCVACCFVVVIVMDNHMVVMDNHVALLLW